MFFLSSQLNHIYTLHKMQSKTKYCEQGKGWAEGKSPTKKWFNVNYVVVVVVVLISIILSMSTYISCSWLRPSLPLLFFFMAFFSVSILIVFILNFNFFGNILFFSPNRVIIIWNLRIREFFYKPQSCNCFIELAPVLPGFWPYIVIK